MHCTNLGGSHCLPLLAQLLVTTNDSRIRLYDMHDYSMAAKFKGRSLPACVKQWLTCVLLRVFSGLQNDELQIRAYFGNEGKTIVCGSENQNVYVWYVLLLSAFNPSTLAMLRPFACAGRW